MARSVYLIGVRPGGGTSTLATVGSPTGVERSATSGVSAGSLGAGS